MWNIMQQPFKRVVSSINSFHQSTFYVTALLHSRNISHLCMKSINSLVPHITVKSPFFPLVNSSRGLKYKDVLTKRCEACYFQKIEDRWYVFCTKHPRHKQAQKMDLKEKYIVTHITHGKRKF